MRALDRNEASYVRVQWRALLLVNRVQMIGAVCICLVCLAGASVVGAFGFQRGGVANGVFSGVMLLFFLGMAGAFGFVFFVRRKAESEPLPVPTMAIEIAGPFWEKASARSMTRHGIGDTQVSVPPQWLPLLRRTGSSRVLTAEVAEGPAETSILLSVNGVLSLSDEIARGYLSGSGGASAPVLFATFALIAFFLAALMAAATYDSDLTLWRYSKVGSGVTRFSSVAELERAHPLSFGRVQVAGVTLERRGRRAFAQDEPPPQLGDAVQLASDLERIGRQIEQAPCADGTTECSADEQERHTEATARELAKTLENAQAWVERLAAPRQGGLRVRTRDDIAPDLEPARQYFRGASQTLGTEADRAKRTEERVTERTRGVASFTPGAPRGLDVKAIVRESARRIIAQEAETELEDLVSIARSEISDTARVVAARHDLDGILYRQPTGEEWLALDARYDQWGLGAQVVATVAGLLSAILIAVSARQMARGRRLYRERVAALPRSL